jgi:hypothetical protein
MTEMPPDRKGVVPDGRSRDECRVRETMNWYFGLSAASFASGDHDWPSLIRVAVHSARKHTSLIPHFLWDGPDHEFLDEMRRLGVTIIPHRVSFFDELARFNPDPVYLATSAGCFLRTEIPRLEMRDAFVLYTDADVMFLRDPVPALNDLQPEYFAAASEFTFEDGLNSGVLLLNVAAMRNDHALFVRFIRQNLSLGLDQDMYRRFYADRFQKLPPQWNWKPYWGQDDAAGILHWHGIKPVVVQRLFDDPAARTVWELQQLFHRDEAGYAAYLGIFKTLLAEAARAVDAPKAAMIARAGQARRTASDAREPLPRRTPKHAHAIAACARWETRYIVEWLNYYRAIGFDHVYLYCNDDDPTDLYERVLPFTAGPDPFVTFSYYPEQGQQERIYAHFLRNHLQDCEWISFFDIDEYLRLPPDATIGDFMRRFDSAADCVLFNWIFFGPNGHKSPPDGHLLAHLTARDTNLHPLTKFVCRASVFTTADGGPAAFGAPFWHSPAWAMNKPMKIVNVLGEDMAHYHDGFPDAARAWVNRELRKAAILSTAVVHHYAFRSEQAFFERTSRGLRGDFAGQTAWRDLALSDGFRDYLAGINEVTDVTLADFWANRAKRAWLTNVLPAAETMPISRNKPATQSSVSAWSRFPAPDQDAAGAVNGHINGKRKFHTDIENEPWWQVDLEGFATIRKIVVYNTTDPVAFRFKNFRLSVSIDGAAWIDIASKTDDAVVGGVDSAPYVWAGPGTAWGRFVRVTLRGRDFLHLDQVEVFGELP